MIQTSLGVKFSSLVISLAYGNLFLGILLVGVASFILGMGLPTTAAYIVLSVMAVPALLNLGEGVGLSLLAAHLIVFWYSLDSCFTPPVCVPAYTAGGIADANPSKAAWAAFRSAKGMYVIPLMFAYTPLISFDDPLALAETFIAGVFGFLALSAVMVGHMFRPLTWLDRAILLVAAAGLFWPAWSITPVVWWCWWSRWSCSDAAIVEKVAGRARRAGVINDGAAGTERCRDFSPPQRIARTPLGTEGVDLPIHRA